MPIETIILSITAILFILLVFLGLYMLRNYLRSQSQQNNIPQSNIPDILIKRYQRVEQLGRGMNAGTYLVQDIQDDENTIVAKVLLTPIDDSRISYDSYRRHRLRFQREMKNLLKIQPCPYVVPILNIYPNTIPPFFVMERCEESLADILKGGPLSIQEFLEAIVDILKGLYAIHTKNIIHRDLKPANILKLRSKWVLADFGMSLLGDDKSIITAQESLPGTIPYTAPEVTYSENVTCTADIFSLGVCIKEMLTTHTTHDKLTSDLLLNGTEIKTKEEVKLFDDVVKEMINYDEPMRPQSIINVYESLQDIFKKINMKRTKGNKLKGIEKIRNIDSVT
ncbi:MAG: serine/threonine-protein kinase [Candidatus Hermodarchaeota archaeon]